MRTRRLSGVEVSEIGLGCMSLSHAYGRPTEPEAAKALLRAAVEAGVTHFDTAALYGFGRNEALVGEALAPFRQSIFLASKCGMTGVDGKRVIDGRPETLKRTCEESLGRLRTEVIDLYYLHRVDKAVPVEESVGALADLVREGKIRSIGLSEVSAGTLRRAHAVHPIAAVQSEYSLWTRNPEIGVLEACRELGAALVAFSPVGRGFFSGAVPDPQALPAGDIRKGMPRFQEPHFTANLKFLDALRRIAAQTGATPAQLALAWLLSKGGHVLPIPGTTSVAHLREDLGGARTTLSADVLAQLNGLQRLVSGPRYPAATQVEIDTEQFADEAG